MDNILITGSTGLLGSHVKKIFDNHSNCDCKGVSRSSADFHVDILDYEELKKINFYPDIIVHAAANMSDDIEDTFFVNEVGTLNICKFAKEKKTKHLIFISSISVYTTEDNELYNAYARSKHNAENIAKDFCKRESIKLTILRFSQIYDFQGIAIKHQAMLYGFISNIKANNEININGSKNPLRNYVDIDYCTKVIYDVFQTKKPGIYNIVNPMSHTLSEIAYMIFELLELTPVINFLKDKNDIPSIYIPRDQYYIFEKYPLHLKNGLERIINYGQ